MKKHIISNMNKFFSVLAGPAGYALCEYTVLESHASMGYPSIYRQAPAWVKTVGDFEQIIPINSKGDYCGLFERRPLGTAKIIQSTSQL